MHDSALGWGGLEWSALPLEGRACMLKPLLEAEWLEWRHSIASALSANTHQKGMQWLDNCLCSCMAGA
jgi:hypothetical protein